MPKRGSSIFRKIERANIAGDIVNDRAEQAVKQNISVVDVVPVFNRHEAGKHQFAFHAHACGSGSGKSGMIGLSTADGDDCVGAGRLSLSEEKFQLPELVATAAQTVKVLTLDIDIGAA
jgi:hypothetical protein